jgi:hypothetical protein
MRQSMRWPARPPGVLHRAPFRGPNLHFFSNFFPAFHFARAMYGERADGDVVNVCGRSVGRDHTWAGKHTDTTLERYDAGRNAIPSAVRGQLENIAPGCPTTRSEFANRSAGLAALSQRRSTRSIPQPHRDSNSGYEPIQHHSEQVSGFRISPANLPITY